MNITLICPFCNGPLSLVNVNVYANSDRRTVEIGCSNASHSYSATAATEAEARAILEKPQKQLVDALSAKIALPIEQRRHNERRAKFNRLFYFAAQVRDRFKRDMEQGFKTRDKEFAVDLLTKGLDQ